MQKISPKIPWLLLAVCILLFFTLPMRNSLVLGAVAGVFGVVVVKLISIYKKKE
jgi:hypothetical protein